MRREKEKMNFERNAKIKAKKLLNGILDNKSIKQ